MSIDSLAKEIQGEYRKWRRSTKIYGTAYVFFRVFLIIASGIVASEKNLGDSYASFLVKAIPVLAVAVTIFTALDTWMKPRDKWRGFMEDRDDLCDLMIRAESAENPDAGLVNDLREEFKKLRRRHREKNVY